MDILSPQFTLLAGIGLSFVLRSPGLKTRAKIWSSTLLQLSVILLGASLNFNSVLEQGLQGMLITFVSIIGVFLLGRFGTNLLKVNREQGFLITMGTAICGGSAIGALSPVIQADHMAITISIGVVFFLNALAVFIFPFIGSVFELTQDQFGLWAALAVHDTSSVVAASSIYGERSLEVATTIKLIRALWIIPVTLFFSLRLRGPAKKVAIPWFILGFLGVSLLFTFLDIPLEYKEVVTALAKTGFALTLFLIGLTFDLVIVTGVGIQPFLFGTGLWIIVSAVSLTLIRMFM